MGNKSRKSRKGQKWNQVKNVAASHQPPAAKGLVMVTRFDPVNKLFVTSYIKGPHVTSMAVTKERAKRLHIRAKALLPAMEPK